VSSNDIPTPAGNRGTRWPLIAVLALALVLRLIEARGVRLWFDEIYIVLVGRMSIPDIVRTAAADIHPPLHFIVRHLWQSIGGEGDRWLKLLSIGFGLVAIAFTEALGRRAISPRAGLLAAFLSALCPAHINVSQIVDVHPMLWALATFNTWAAWRYVGERQARHALALGIGATIALYSHYLAIPLSVALALWGAAMLARDPRALARWLLLWLAVTAAFVPQAAVFVTQFHREGNGGFFTFPTAHGLFSLARAIGFGSYVAPPLFALACVAAWTDRRHRAIATLLSLLVVLTVPSTRWWAFVVTRDMLVVMPFAYLLVTLGLERLPGRLAHAVASLLLVALAAREWHHHERFPEPLQLARAEQLIAEKAKPGDIVLHAETHSLLFFRYYQPQRRNLLLADPGSRVPYFDAGLVIPDAWLTTPVAWTAARDSGLDWWGVRVDRAYTTRGHSTRAGARNAAEFDSLDHDHHWHFKPVEVWHDVDAAR